MRAWHRAVLLIGVAVVAGCGGGGADQANSQDTLTRRQRDSVLGASRLPGAAGVRGALRVADTAAARAGRLDSIRP
jgi:hypothetical protein